MSLCSDARSVTGLLESEVLDISKLHECLGMVLLFQTLRYLFFTSIDKHVLPNYAHLPLFSFLGTIPVLTPNVGAAEHS